MAWLNQDLRPLQFDFDMLGGDSRLQFATLYTHILQGIFSRHQLVMSHTLACPTEADTVRVIQQYLLTVDDEDEEPTHLVLDTKLCFALPLEPSRVLTQMLDRGFASWTRRDAEMEVKRLVSL
jgi:hypothetical protein